MKKGFSIFILVLVIVFALACAGMVFYNDIAAFASERFGVTLSVPDFDGLGVLQKLGLGSNSDSEQTGSDAQTASKAADADSLTDKDALTANGQTDSNKVVSIVFTGDVLLGKQTSGRYASQGVSGLLSDQVLDILTSADVTEINNEFPFSTRGNAVANKEYTFRADPKYVTLLNDMGVDVAGLANNHVLDYGDEALLDTLTTLDDAGIAHTGAGNSIEEASQLITYELGGKTYGFLAASRVIPFGSWNIENHQPGVLACYDSTLTCNCIREAKKNCDYVFVCVHWGTEHTTEIENHQKSLAADFVAAGADAVIGDHTHCLQGIEFYDGKPVFYSLGNFIFSDTADLAGMVEVKVDGDNEPAYYLYPTYTSDIKTSLRTDLRDVYDYVESISFGVTLDDDGLVRQAD